MAEMADDGAATGVSRVVFVEALERSPGDVVLRRLEVEAAAQLELEILEAIEL